MYVDNEERNQNTSFSEKEIFPDKAALFDMRKIIGQAANDTRQQEEPKPDPEEPVSLPPLVSQFFLEFKPLAGIRLVSKTPMLDEVALYCIHLTTHPPFGAPAPDS